jgi:hypothetical protein
VSPEQAAGLTILIEAVERLGAWPLASFFLAALLGPWIMAFVLARGQERRFEAVKEMYVKNAKLAEGYEKLCLGLDRREQDLRSIIMMNSQAMTRLTDAIQAGRHDGF